MKKQNLFFLTKAEVECDEINETVNHRGSVVSELKTSYPPAPEPPWVEFFDGHHRWLLSSGASLGYRRASVGDVFGIR